MNIPKSHSVPAIIISDYDSNAEDPFLKLKSAEAKNKIQNKIITSPTNSFEEKPQVEIKKPLTKTKVGNYFISLHLMIKVYPLQHLPRSESFEDEPSSSRVTVAPAATKQKSRKKIATSFNKVRSNTKLQKSIQDSIVTKEKLCETIGEDAFQVKSRSYLFILTILTPGHGIEQQMHCRPREKNFQ